MTDFSTQRYLVVNGEPKPVGTSKVLLDSTQVVLCYQHDPWAYLFHPKHTIDTIRERCDKIIHPPPPPETVTLGQLMTQGRYHPLDTIMEEEEEEELIDPLQYALKSAEKKRTSSSGYPGPSVVDTGIVGLPNSSTTTRYNNIKRQILKKASVLQQLEKQILKLSVNNFSDGGGGGQQQQRQSARSWNSPFYRALLATHPKFGQYVRFPSILASTELQQYVASFREEMNEMDIWYQSAYVTIGRSKNTPEEERVTYFVVGCEKKRMKEARKIAKMALWDRIEYLVVVLRKDKMMNKRSTLI